MVLTIIKRPHALATTTTATTPTATTTTTAIPSATSSPLSSTTSTGINTQGLNSNDNNTNDYCPEQFSVELSPGFTIHSVCAFERDDDNDDDKHTIELFTTAWKSDVVASGAVKDGGLLGCWEGTAPVFENIPVTLL
jgi:hypothetical protein